MNIIFAGTPDFAAAALNAIYQAGFHISLVLTQPDRPKGRGMQLTASPVKQAALALGLPIAQPEKLRGNQEALSLLQSVNADVMVVAAYGLLLPQEVLDTPKHGCLNIHASLLPRWRGAAPIQRAIEAGDKETGVCIMQMDAGLDTGAIVSTHRYTIQNTDTANEVHDALMYLGAKAIVEDLQRLADSGSLNSQEGFDLYQSIVGNPLAKLILIGILWAYLHHAFAGIRFLLLDLHKGLEAKTAQKTAKIVAIAAPIVALIMGVILW